MNIPFPRKEEGGIAQKRRPKHFLNPAGQTSSLTLEALNKNLGSPIPPALPPTAHIVSVLVQLLGRHPTILVLLNPGVSIATSASLS